MTDYDQLNHLIAKETQAFEKRIAELIQERHTALEQGYRTAGHLADLYDAVKRQRDEAQEAAENYWEAWQDAVVYWKDRVRSLEAECVGQEGRAMRAELDLEQAQEAAMLAFDHLRERFWHGSVNDWEAKYPFLRDSPRSDLRGVR